MDRLLNCLDVAVNAAEAASSYYDSVGPSNDPRLDPRHHSEKAEAAVMKCVIQPFYDPSVQSTESAGRPFVLHPTSGVYAKLMAVHDAADQPLEAVRLALQVLHGELPLTISGQPAVVSSSSSALLSAEALSLVAEAMLIANEAGLC